jgi:hypothetical protein
MAQSWTDLKHNMPPRQQIQTQNSKFQTVFAAIAGQTG